MYLWYLGDPARPILVGDLHLVMKGRAVSLRYATEWLQVGFPLSEDVPLVDIEHFPRNKDCAVGAVDDARPDRWGERVIHMLDRPARLSILDFLYFAGDDRFGAMGVSTSRERYAPQNVGALPRLADVDEINGVIRQVLAGEPIAEPLRRLIAPGVTMGGARPKALIQIEGVEWLLKFAEDERSAEPLIEHATMTLAAKAGISVAETRPVPFAKNGIALAIRRFDRGARGARRHALSAKVALEAASAELSYPELALLLRRRGVTEGQQNMREMHELFRRMVFNILMDNTDDHEKNHVLLMTDAQHYTLAPAFDVLPTSHSLTYQAMVVGDRGAESSLDNALSRCTDFWLGRKAAIEEARVVARVVANWREHFIETGIGSPALAELARHIDRPFLLEQRSALLV